MVIEPAKASEVAPLIVDAYELTPREVDVTRALARGLTTTEIARELHLSRYTVQDHLKSVYEKTGVSSRGELVAKMFADHYHDGLRDAITRRSAQRLLELVEHALLALAHADGVEAEEAAFLGRVRGLARGVPEPGAIGLGVLGARLGGHDAR